MGKVDDVGLGRGWVYVGSVDRCTLLVDDVELNVGGGTVDRWSLGVGADCFLFLFYYCLDMERYFQFHRPRSHGCWFSKKEPHKKCYFCKEEGGGGFRVYCKTCQKFISKGAFLSHLKAGCPTIGCIPKEDTFRNNFIAALGEEGMGELVGRGVEEGFVLKKDGKLYVGSWSRIGTLVIEEKKKEELETWAQASLRKKKRKRKRELDYLGEGGLDGDWWGGEGERRVSIREQGISSLFFSPFLFFFFFLFLGGEKNFDFFFFLSLFLSSLFLFSLLTSLFSLFFLFFLQINPKIFLS